MYICIPGFIVQLRSLYDLSPLPCITLGDTGGKFGSGAYNYMDNRVMCFDEVCPLAYFVPALYLPAKYILINLM
jgi:hypothetical protein